MTREPGLPHKLKWGGRTAARAGEAEYPTGIGAAGHTGPKDVVTAGVHESAADGAYCKYTRLKDIAHEEG